MSAPQIGDVITKVEELDALPQGAVVVSHAQDAWVHVSEDGKRWFIGVEHCDPDDGYFIEGRQVYLHQTLPATLVYLPGQPPRPERVVKAEALREAAAYLKSLASDWNPTAGYVRGGMDVIARVLDRADRIEAGGDLP